MKLFFLTYFFNLVHLPEWAFDRKVFKHISANLNPLYTRVELSATFVSFIIAHWRRFALVCADVNQYQWAIIKET